MARRFESWRTIAEIRSAAVYTVRFGNAVYVLHAFQKKSPSGIRTAKKDIDLINRRLNEARLDYEVRYGGNKD